MKLQSAEKSRVCRNLFFPPLNTKGGIPLQWPIYRIKNLEAGKKNKKWSGLFVLFLHSSWHKYFPAVVWCHGRPGWWARGEEVAPHQLQESQSNLLSALKTKITHQKTTPLENPQIKGWEQCWTPARRHDTKNKLHFGNRNPGALGAYIVFDSGHSRCISTNQSSPWLSWS